MNMNMNMNKITSKGKPSFMEMFLGIMCIVYISAMFHYYRVSSGKKNAKDWSFLGSAIVLYIIHFSILGFNIKRLI